MTVFAGQANAKYRPLSNPNRQIQIVSMDTQSL